MSSGKVKFFRCYLSNVDFYFTSKSSKRYWNKFSIHS